jgi:hypothetical protein
MYEKLLKLISNYSNLSILSSIDYFYSITKYGGLIKIPEQLLKNVSSWALSIYCNKINELILQALNDKNIKEIVNFDPILEALLNKDYNYFIKNSVDLKLPIPYADGKYDLSEHCLELVINKSEMYSFYLKINPKSFPSSKIPLINIKEGYLDEKQVMDYIARNNKYIVSILKMYKKFADEISDVITDEKAFELKNECNKYIFTKNNPEFFPLALEELNYFSEKDLQRYNKINPKLKTIFIFDKKSSKKISSEVNWSAGYNKNNLYIFRDIPKEKLQNLDIKYELDSLYESVRHELAHMVQEYIDVIKDLPGEDRTGGLTSEEIKTKNLHIKEPTNKPDDIKSKDLYLDPSKFQRRKLKYDIDSQLLKDSEFYTYLASSVNNFKLVKNKFKPELYDLLFKVWINQIDFDSFRNYAIKILEEKYFKKYSVQDFNEEFKNEINLIKIGSRFFEALLDQHEYELKQNVAKRKETKYQKAVKILLAQSQ